MKSALSYDKGTGVFHWIARRSRKCPVGSIAGMTRKDGYQRIGMDYKEYYCHRLAWEFVNGPIPDGMDIDHIDGNPSNNAISNLRLATRSQNNENQGRAKSNNKSSGLLGVSWFAKTKQWRARIYISGREKSLGYFNDKFEAYEAYKAAKSVHHFTGALA